MADDINPPSVPPNFPGYHTDRPAAPARPVVGYTTAPLAEPAFSVKDYGNGLLRWLLNVLIGGGVGAATGAILYYVLHFLNYWDGPMLFLVGVALVAGLVFNHFIVHLLGLAPKKNVDASTATGKAAAKSADDPAQPDGVREIVETIVFVVVLVLMLKSFAAEAFVIPTGSMAVTLLGDQKNAVCPQCGYRFPVNASQQVDPRGRPDWVRGCVCPNCREHISFVPHHDSRFFGVFTLRGPFYDPDTHQERGGPVAPNEIVDPDANSGDRVLVSKFAYDLFETPPDREDVVVFKYPGDDAFPRTGPFLDGVAMNYIKRLVGLSRETIAIHNGNLYALSPDKGPQYDDLKDVIDPAQRAELAKQLWQKKYMHVNESVDAFNQGEFHILRKSPDNIVAMRRIVYDNDHQAADLVGPQWARWTGRDGDPAWTTVNIAANEHVFRVTPATDDQVHWLSYRHILRDPGGFGAGGQSDKPLPPQLITDFMGYNTWEPHRVPSQNWVGDLILDCDVQSDGAQGELTLELSKGVDRFRARWDLSTGICTLSRLQGDKEEKLDSQPTGLKGGGTHQVRFANVDEQLTVWVDEALPFGAGVTYTAPKTEGATKENDLEPASVGLKGIGAMVRGLKLWRDTYYTTGANHGEPGLSDAPNSVDFADPNTWGPLRQLPTRTMYIQPEHYLCMGDNSPESSDGRTWGAVPKRLLLGKALAVYWPADRFGRIR